ncbi:transposable element Tc1 transposase [Trichonephila clavipes]|nr:transposable element Tc1 transposase [Trichonephila clavipes]
MSPRRNKEKFQQLTEFERGRISGLREGRFSYRIIGVREQRNISTVIRVWKEWTDELRTTQKTGSGRRKGKSERNDQHLRCMAVNDRTASSRAWQAVWHQVVFSDESRFNLWDNDGCICVRRYVGTRCLPECVTGQHGGLTPGFMQDNALSHVAKTVREFCSAQHMQLHPWPAHSPDMPPIEHVWELVGLRLARDPRPAASKDELLLCIQAV